MGLTRFVDAHVHMWTLETIAYPWLTPPFSDDGPNGSVEPIAKPYLLADYFRDAAGFPVEKIVHVDAGAAPADALDETRWLQAMADTEGHPDAIVAFAPLNDPRVERTLAAHVESRNVRGIRQILNWHRDARRTYTPANLLDDDAFARGYALLGKYGLSFDLQIYPGQMTQAWRLARAHPDIPVILNHMGMPVEGDADSLAQWKGGLALLASLPHVAVKISGPGFIDRNWSMEKIRPYVLTVIDLFGPQRCAFASDFPTDKLWADYAKTLTAYNDITNAFSPDERDALFAATATRLYRL